MSLDFTPVFEALPANMATHAEPLRHAVADRWDARPHGRADEWNRTLNALPRQLATDIDLSSPTIRIGRPGDITDVAATRTLLETFKPWRKGPWEICGIEIDTEWRSDWKWDRIAPHITPLSGRRVLDVGAGNGYYMLRCIGEGARFVLGVDPTVVFLYQFAAVKRFLADDVPAWLLPLRGEDLPPMAAFDTVFSLGVLYHRRSPIDHLTELLALLEPGGELVLETLVIDGDEQEVLVPEDRYAKMANVWFIPSPAALELWLIRAGFDNVRTVDVTPTTTAEQRATDWMTFQSLAEFLDPENPELTAEGLPAPVRAVVVANKRNR